MPIAPVILDDLTWSDLTDAARGRIPAASNGRWTLHAPVDPGITLLELHAWLLEQRLYWMDQVPDSMSRGALALLGDAAQDAQCATSVLYFNPDPASSLVRVAAQTAMQLQDSDPPLIVSLTEPVTVLPLASQDAGIAPLVGVQIGTTNHSPDLAAGRDICLFGDGANSPEVEITLNLTGPLPTPLAADTISLALLLETDGNPVPPQWSPDAVDGVAPPAQLAWSYDSTAGTRTRFAAADVSDGTGGLRRSGIVRLPLPADWQASAVTSDGYHQFRIYLSADTAGFAVPPQLVGLWPNVAIARHSYRTRQQVVPDWLPLPGIAIQLDQDKPPPLVEGTRLRLRERDGQWHWWQPTADLAFHGREDRVFVIDRDAGVLRFGNGEIGRIPIPTALRDLPAVDVHLSVGGGDAGNVAEFCHWEPADSAPEATPVAVNIVAGIGGADPEPLGDARRRVAVALRRADRAVLDDDFVTLACTTPGVAIRRAHAAIGYHPDFPCRAVPGAITVFVVPDAPRPTAADPPCPRVVAPVPDAAALAAVAARLDRARLIASEVYVRPPVYRRTAITVDVQGNPASPETLRADIANGLGDFLDPLIGGGDGNGWPFGEPLRPSALLRVAQAAAAGRGDVVGLSIRLLDVADPTDEGCQDVDIGAHALPALDSIRIRISAPPVVTGGLQ